MLLMLFGLSVDSSTLHSMSITSQMPRTLAEKVTAFDNDVKASLDERIATAEKNLADAIAAVEVGSDVYYVSAWGRDPVEVAVSIAADYNTDELQIFKVYGTWYVQNYGDLSVDGYTVYFTVDGATYEVVYDNGAFYAITRNAAGEEVSRAIFSVGSADASVINDSIKNVIAGFDSDDTGEDFVYDNAQALNTSKGVVFAYGQYPVDGAIVGELITSTSSMSTSSAAAARMMITVGWRLRIR